MKIVVWGFALNGRGSYLRSGWNALDLAIVAIGIIALALEAALSDASDLIWIRALKSLRRV